MINVKRVFTLLIFALCSNLAVAEERVLIVGVGEYENPDNNLPGIDLDIRAMRDTALLMGFDRSAIKILRDEEATRDRIIEAFETWLIDGVEENDRVVFYFSGHGSQFYDSNGDENDGQDEALIAYDFNYTEVNGKSDFRGAIVDETLGDLIRKIPSNNVMVFIDACRSGTATRSISTGASNFGVDSLRPKSLYHGRNTVPADSYVADSVLRNLESKEGFIDLEDSNYMAFTAARDTENALATGNGSLFTLGLKEAIKNTVESSGSITPEELQRTVQGYIERYVDSSQLFHPQLSGNTSYFDAPIATVPLPADGNGEMPDGTMWASLLELTEGLAPLDIATNATVYKLGDSVEISIDIPQEGYLNVVTVDSSDQDMVLFPNRYHMDNKVTAGNFEIPTNSMNFTLPASEPAGETLVVAFFSTNPLNLYESQVGGNRDEKGNYTEDFASLSGVATRAISVLGRSSTVIKATSLVVNTQR